MGDTPFKIITNQEVWDWTRQHERTDSGGGHADHEARVRKLEWRYNALLAGLLTGLVGALVVIARAF